MCGDMLEAIARIAPSQPNEAMVVNDAHCPSQEWYHFTRPKMPGQNSRAKFFGLDSKLFSKIKIDSKRGLGTADPEKG
jgi:hypothetical protein